MRREISWMNRKCSEEMKMARLELRLSGDKSKICQPLAVNKKFVLINKREYEKVVQHKKNCASSWHLLIKQMIGDRASFRKYNLIWMPWANLAKDQLRAPSHRNTFRLEYKCWNLQNTVFCNWKTLNKMACLPKS